MKKTFNVTELTKFGNGGGGAVTLKPVIQKIEDCTGTIKLELTEEQLDEFKDLGEFVVIIER